MWYNEKNNFYKEILCLIIHMSVVANTTTTKDKVAAVTITMTTRKI